MPPARYVPSARECFISYRLQIDLQISQWTKFIISHLPKANISLFILNLKQKGINTEQKTIKELAVELTVEINDLCDTIKAKAVFTNQLLRSCSSIGANTHEAKYAQSTADFINKPEIALKECYETEYWLEILFKVHSLSEQQYKKVNTKCGTIRRKLIASITTAKKNRGQ